MTTVGSVVCARCGESNPQGSFFCASCGVPLPPERQPGQSTGEPAPVQNATTLKVLAVVVAIGLLACMALCMGLVIFLTLPNPFGLALIVVLAVIPAAVYSMLVVTLDRFDHEPWYTMLGAFLWGAIVATFFSLILNTVTGLAVLTAWDEYTMGVVLPIVVAPIVEETTKGVAILLLLLAVRHELDSVLDGIIYGALVGLGFAMTENALYYANFLAEGGPIALFIGFFVRAGFGGFAHAIFTAATGAGLGWARRRYGRGVGRFVAPALGLLAAMSLHGIWNGVAVVSFLLGGLGALLAILGLFFLLSLPAVLTVLVVAILQWDRHLTILQRQLATEVSAGTLSLDEYTMLTSPRLRRKAAWDALVRGGVRAWWRMRVFMRLASRLAFQKHHAMHGETRPSGFRKQTDPELRAALSKARQPLTQN